MAKTYYDFMNEISGQELYDSFIENGMFSEKLPPIFDCSEFLSYCKTNKSQNFQDKWYSYVRYNSMRNNNIPRPIGIPTPMSHELLCCCLRDNWSKIQAHYQSTTANQKHIVSRIHIRKMRGTNVLFIMNYKNWRTDGSPEPDLLIGKKYLVKADISQCYPSVYTHAIPWALVTKANAKQNANHKSQWYNQIDHYTQITKDGETHGILIGPHTSNVLSEIILCSIDQKLCQNNWEYYRNIDDYTCFVRTREEADRFLVDLNRELKEYDLSLNHKKTQILELPLGITEQWIHQIQDRTTLFGIKHKYIDYLEVQAFLDFCIELVSANKENTSIILYALKVLQKHELTDNAKVFLAKRIVSLSLLYPYIVPLLDSYIFSSCSINKKQIKEYLEIIYNHYFDIDNFEAASYVLFYATKNDVLIDGFDINAIIQKNDCILSLCGLIYCRHNKMRTELNALKNYANTLVNNNEFEENWVFVYECLTVGFLKGDWKSMKKNNVSFLKHKYK